MMESGLIPLLPDTSPPHEAFFWAGLREGVLRVQYCSHCARWQFPPLMRCPNCARKPDWRAVSGQGTIWSVTEIHPPVLPTFARLTPYLVALIELVESPSLRIVGNLLPPEGGAINTLRLADVSIGMGVTASIRELADGIYWPRWRMVSSEGN